MRLFIHRGKMLSRALLRRIDEKILLLAIVLVPWVKLELRPRIIWADVLFLLWGFVLSITWIARKRSLWKPPWPLSAFGLLIVVWVIALLLSSLNASHLQAYTFETTGLIYLATLSWFLSYILSRSLLSFERAMAALFVGIYITLVSGLLGIVYALLTENFPPIFYNNARKLIATFKYPNQLAGFLVLFAPLVWEQFQHARGLKLRLFYGGVSLLLLIEIAASGSRAGLVATLFGLGLSFAYSLRHRSRRSWIILAGVLAVGFGGVVIYMRSTIWVITRALSVFQLIKSGEFTDPFRIKNWQIALRLFAQYPLTGYGVANVAQDFGHETHNTYLAVAAETGILGLLAFLGLLILIIFLAWQNTHWAKMVGQWSSIAMGFWIGLLANLLYATQHHILRTRHLWVMFAFLVALNAILRREKNKWR